MKVIKRPTDETIQQIDFVIQGLENGKYEELAKEVEFHQKLKGEDAPEYFQSLIRALEEAQTEIISLTTQNQLVRQDINDLMLRLNELETAKQTNYNDIQTIAKGIKYAIDPSPLERNYELSEINHWLHGRGIS